MDLVIKNIKNQNNKSSRENSIDAFSPPQSPQQLNTQNNYSNAVSIYCNDAKQKFIACNLKYDKLNRFKLV